MWSLGNGTYGSKVSGILLARLFHRDQLRHRQLFHRAKILQIMLDTMPSSVSTFLASSMNYCWLYMYFIFSYSRTEELP